MSAPVYAVHAACIRGVEAVPVTVEVSMGGGLPSISIVGMADSTVLEARSRMRCAFRSVGFEVPKKSITINLAPSDMRKSGTGLDLPIAVAVLALSGQIPVNDLDSCLFVGELALDGSVCPVKGEIAYQVLARDTHLTLIEGPSSPHQGLFEAARFELDNIVRLRMGVRDAIHRCDLEPDRPPLETKLDYADVVGQEVAKRGLAIAAAGDLGLLMIGAPGSGKTMLARRMTTILPKLTQADQQEALCIHSVAGEDISGLLAGDRPFRNPHHSISAAGLVGGGRPVRPGEISLAHGGCLFLDELAEFPSGVLQMLRQPLEEGVVRIVRADGMYIFPSRFQLIAASNPCPCGYLGDREVACTCSATAIERYRSKLAGPLIDRIDIVLDVCRPDPSLIIEGAEGMDSEGLSAMVATGRAFALERRDDSEPVSTSSRTSLDRAIAAFHLDRDAEDALVGLSQCNKLTGRGIKRLCRIARTVADIDESACVRRPHVLEASMFQGRRNA